jgi:hypothetical protein
MVSSDFFLQDIVSLMMYRMYILCFGVCVLEVYMRLKCIWFKNVYDEAQCIRFLDSVFF